MPGDHEIIETDPTLHNWMLLQAEAGVRQGAGPEEVAEGLQEHLAARGAPEEDWEHLIQTVLDGLGR